MTGVTLAVLAVAAGCDSDDQDTTAATGSQEQCRMPFTEYSAGRSVAGIEFEARVPNCGKRPFVGYIYGTCHATSDTGCSPPVEVQSWAFKDRKPSRAPAGHEIHVRRGDVTIVIFARSDRLAEAALRTLQPVPE